MGVVHGMVNSYKMQHFKILTMPVQSVPHDLALHCVCVETVSTVCQVALLTAWTLHLKYWYTLNSSSFFYSWRNMTVTVLALSFLGSTKSLFVRWRWTSDTGNTLWYKDGFLHFQTLAKPLLRCFIYMRNYHS